MELTVRQMEIIETIKKCRNTATGKTLAKATGYSLRTIQAEMNILRNLGLIVSSQNGYTLAGDFELGKNTEDEELLIKKLLTDENCAFAQLAEAFYLSESALRSMIQRINILLKPYKLKAAVKDHAVCLEGTEVNKRRLLRKMVFKDANDDQHLVRYFGDVDVIKLKEIINTSINSSGYYIQYPYANNLILSIMICLYRVYKGSHTPSDYHFDPDTSEYILAKKITDHFYDLYQKEIKDSDICYIASMFQGQIVEDSHTKSKLYADESFESRIAELLSATFDDYDIHIDISAYLHSFALHIAELIKRGKVNNFIINDAQISMKENCPYVYDVAVHFTRQLMLEYDLTIPDDEVAFLAVHIGLIIHSETKNNNTVSILFYVSNHYGIADRIMKMVKEKHREQVSIVNVDPVSCQIPKQDFDLIVTTEKIDLIGKQVINITPFFDAVDRVNVDAAITECIRNKRKRTELITLMECFSPELFFIREDIDTSEKAIEFLGNKLIDYGIVDKDFIDSVKAREMLSPTSFFHSFAIPHSIKTAARKTMFAVLINEKGIAWNHTEVKLCLMIAIRKKDLHDFPDLYDGVVRVLCDPDRFRNLLEAKNLQSFIDHLK